MRRVELRGMTRYNGPLKMGGLKFLIIAVLALLPIFGLFLDCGLAQVEDETYSNSLVLNIYLNDAGRALVTGYAESIDGLTFLNASQYSYDQDTRQIYALTNSLTYKSGDDWEARLLSQGYYGEYHSTFYLPGTVRLSKINSSLGLEYLVSASNESFVVDIHGYDIMNPDVAISYQLPIGEAPPEGLMSQADLLPSLGVLMRQSRSWPGEGGLKGQLLPLPVLEEKMESSRATRWLNHPRQVRLTLHSLRTARQNQEYLMVYHLAPHQTVRNYVRHPASLRAPKKAL
jgi:hypothetical protein